MSIDQTTQVAPADVKAATLQVISEILDTDWKYIVRQSDGGLTVQMGGAATGSDAEAAALLEHLSAENIVRKDSYTGHNSVLMAGYSATVTRHGVAIRVETINLAPVEQSICPCVQATNDAPVQPEDGAA